jgi:hypothetical protein
MYSSEYYNDDEFWAAPASAQTQYQGQDHTQHFPANGSLSADWFPNTALPMSPTNVEATKGLRHYHLTNGYWKDWKPCKDKQHSYQS